MQAEQRHAGQVERAVQEACRGKEMQFAKQIEERRKEWAATY